MFTGITVTYNTVDLTRRAIESFRKFHPDAELIVVDNSEKHDTNYSYLDKLDDNTTVVHVNFNSGHGRGMNIGIGLCTTKYALIFDSDVEFLSDPMPDMLQLMNDNVFGVGWITEIQRDGYDFGTNPRFKERIKYLHPFLHLLNVEIYRKFEPYCHHGAPSYKTMVDIHDKNKSNILVQLPGLHGHSSGRGMNWIGRPNKYVRHDFGGTRNANKQRGEKEIALKWEK